MYIKDAYKKKGGKKYFCLALVETERTRKVPRQKIILTLGKVGALKGQWPLLAEVFEGCELRVSCKA